MKRLLPLLCLVVSACASRETERQTYDNNDLELVMGNAARMSCSCLFVMQMPTDFCQAWVKASPSVASFKVDFEKQTVESTGLLTFGARARFIDARRGCILE